jgi:undecaprenyl-phosphate 4-deoxy-4-formamido-L-arabinose transferase
VVIPVYNEGKGLDALVERLRPVLDGLDSSGRPSEVVFVDDGSQDDSLVRLKALAESDRRVRVVELLFNSGQHAAVAAGLGLARGQAVVTLDADLQNPPEEIPGIAVKVLEGYDMVSGIRTGRRDTFFRRLAGALSTRLVSLATGIKLTDYGSMLRGYSGDVARAVAEVYTPGGYIPAIAYICSKRRTEVETSHAEREHGESRYSLRGLLRLHTDVLTGFSVLPLRLAGLMGVLTSLLGAALGVYIIVRRFIEGEVWAQYGVFTLFAIAFFFMGVEMVALAVMGEYVGRIYNVSRRRPRHVIRAVHGGGEQSSRGNPR